MAVRMKDIAKDLNLSVVTISKVLRDHPDIAEDTRERVLRRVRELDYQPNSTARSLVTGRSYLIGLVVPSLLHCFFAEVAQALSAAVGKRGYSLIVSSSEEDSELEVREVQQLIGRKLDALVVASSHNDIEPFQRMERHGLPYVLIDREISGWTTANFVGTDDEKQREESLPNTSLIRAAGGWHISGARRTAQEFADSRGTSRHLSAIKFRMTTPWW